MIICLIGVKGSGKSTLARQLLSTGRFVHAPFAGPLKSMLRTLLFEQGTETDQIESMLNGDLKEIPTSYLSNRTPRHAMQTLGTEWRDMISRTLWTEVWTNKIEKLWLKHDIVVDDMRFLHEEEAVRKFDAHIIQIERSDLHNADSHISESEYLKIVPHLKITNTNGHPEFMFADLCTYLPELKEPSR